MNGDCWSEIAKKTSFDNFLHVVDEYKELSAVIFVFMAVQKIQEKNKKRLEMRDLFC